MGHVLKKILDEQFRVCTIVRPGIKRFAVIPKGLMQVIHKKKFPPVKSLQFIMVAFSEVNEQVQNSSVLVRNYCTCDLHFC
jgi:hypothetical protein